MMMEQQLAGMNQRIGASLHENTLVMPDEVHRSHTDLWLNATVLWNEFLETRTTWLLQAQMMVITDTCEMVLSYALTWRLPRLPVHCWHHHSRVHVIKY